MAGCHLIIRDVFHKTISNLSFSLLVFQQLRSILLCKDAFQVHLWQKLSFSSPFLYPNGLTSILSLRRHCDVVLFTHHLVLWGSCSFHAYPFNRSVVSSLQVLFILSSFASLFNLSAVWNPSYPLCHSFNSSGGSVLLISLSILSSCKVRVQFLPFTVGVLSKLYHSYSFCILF